MSNIIVFLLLYLLSAIIEPRRDIWWRWDATVSSCTARAGNRWRLRPALWPISGRLIGQSHVNQRWRLRPALWPISGRLIGQSHVNQIQTFKETVQSKPVLLSKDVSSQMYQFSCCHFHIFSSGKSKIFLWNFCKQTFYFPPNWKHSQILYTQCARNKGWYS